MIKIGLKIIVVGFIFITLVFIRSIEHQLFYDPFLFFFKSDFQHLEFPNYNIKKMINSLVSRYILNSALTVLIIWTLFQKKSYILKSIQIILLFGLICIPLYYYQIIQGFNWGFYFSYTLRRFIIQPLLVIILIVGFVYHWFFNDSNQSSNN